jgi:hypothetical protein
MEDDMHSKLRRSINGLLVFSIGIVLSLAQPGPAHATDLLDPATQPHLKSWSNIIPPAKRFVVLADFNNEAVLDRETGLVWEQAPEETRRAWNAARNCAGKTVGGRMGWRLPSVTELSSLRDPALPPPYVPANVFSGVQASDYWSATQDAQNLTFAWYVHFGIGLVFTNPKIYVNHVWCVRGPMNADTY